MTVWARDRWFGEDKLTHFVWCYGGQLTGTRVGVPIVLLALFVLAVGLIVEMVQGLRWQMGCVTFAEQPSYRDLAWDALGIAAAIIFALVTR